jgi:hypothetical protein
MAVGFTTRVFELMRVYARGSDTLFLFGPTPHPYGEHDE